MAVVVVVLWVSLGALTATLALTFGARAAGAAVQRRAARYARELKMTLGAFAAQVGAEPVAPRNQLQRRLMQRDLLALRPNLKGRAGEELTRLFVSYGLADEARRDLRARSVVTRRQAAEVLGAMPTPGAQGALLEGLRDRDRLVRLGCARALAELGDEDTIGPVLDALAGEADHPQDAVGTLVGFGEPAVPHLRRQLRPGVPAGPQRLAARALGAGRAAAAAPELRTLLQRGDPRVVADAAHALGAIGDRRSVTGLCRLGLEHPDPQVRQQCCVALGRIDDPSARPALARCLSDGTWQVRDAAARALLALGAEEVPDAIQQAGSTLTTLGAAHLAGVLDVAGQLTPIIIRAAGGDPAADRLVRLASWGGARVRLGALATAAGTPSAYCATVLATPQPGGTRNE